MDSPHQSGWTRWAAPTGRYEYQFQGSAPAVRRAQYLEATDYQFLVMDVDGWLYRIPVRIAADAAEEWRRARAEAPGAPAQENPAAPLLSLAEAQLRDGLAHFTPRENAPYEELDRYFAVDAARARELAKELPIS